MPFYLYRTNKMKPVQLFLYLIINCLFVAKYSSRVTAFYPVCIVAYILFAIIVYWLLNTKQYTLIDRKIKTGVFSCFSLIGGIGILLFLYLINPYTIQVDRWSAIQAFLQYLFSGKYPYAAISHLGNYPSPFPVWQFFHIPFYLLGDIGYGMLFSFILLALSLVWGIKQKGKALRYITLLLISPAFWYEVTVRSDMMYNAIIVFLFVCWLYKKKITIQSNTIFVGIFCGLLLSTRFFVIIPLFLYFFNNYCKADIKHKFIFPLIIIGTFLLTIIPFAIWNFNAFFFFHYNPFILQSRQGSPMEMLLLVAILIPLSLKWKTINDYMAYSSILLFSTVAIAFLYRMVTDHLASSLFSRLYDISYFNMSLPFIIATLSLNYRDTQ
jgi:hypothetical protein